MTQEEKYKKALLEARAVLEPCLKYSNGKVREALDSIDKELKSFESEDERILRVISEAVITFFSDYANDFEDEDRDAALAWLEKQKEQKPADLSKMMVHKEPYIAPVPTPMVADEQKPASISCGHENDAEWGQEDKEKIVTISEIIEHCTTIPYSGGTLTLNKEYKKELLCFIKSLRPSWKPSEDELAKKHLEGYIKGRNDALREMSDFMESHFNTQSGTSIKSGGNE